MGYYSVVATTQTTWPDVAFTAVFIGGMCLMLWIISRF